MSPPSIDAGRFGLAGRADYDLRGAVVSSWDAFVAQVDRADLSTPTRLEGWTVREIAVHLGTWQGRSALTEVLARAGSGGSGEARDADAFNAEVVAAHTDATDAEVRAAVAASREAVADLFDSDDIWARATEQITSVLGQMPLLTVVHAGCYELALHALDIAKATGEACDPALLERGVAALADSTGCLAARSGIDTTIGVVTDCGGWSFTAHGDGGWTTDEIAGDPRGARVSGSATDLLEASSGRADPARLVARRRLRISHIGGLMALAPIIDQVPGLPGGRALSLAARSLGGFGALFGRKR